MVRVRQRSVAMALAATCALFGSLAHGQQPRRGAAAATQAAPAETVAIPTVPTVPADVCIAPEARAHALECPAGSQRYGSHRDTAP
ncbi:MAG: hypothetical protein JWM10_575, partial [Myxococcaceae bacterium]|nr:hypothetical protein [Myxococcaceae bacterium]